MTGWRAEGVRMPFEALPARVRAWVDETVGSPVASWTEQVGGMSPGCATRVVAEDGSRAFVKAVGRELNADSPTLFRREIDMLEQIGDDPLWASLWSSYDDGGWVALLLEDVPGGHPDLADEQQMSDLLAATDRLAARLRRIPVPDGPRAPRIVDRGLVDVAARFRGWRRALDHLDEIPDDLLPARLRERPAELRAISACLETSNAAQLVHWDVRVDNLLRPAPGRIVFVDWGGAGVGPGWCDPLLARLDRVEDPWFDESVAASPALAAAGDDVVTAFLLAFGLALAHQSTLGLPDEGLPTLNEFRRTQARRFLTGAERRIG